jgi:hypothetical protein
MAEDQADRASLCACHCILVKQMGHLAQARWDFHCLRCNGLVSSSMLLCSAGPTCPHFGRVRAVWQGTRLRYLVSNDYSCNVVPLSRPCSIIDLLETSGSHCFFKR